MFEKLVEVLPRSARHDLILGFINEIPHLLERGINTDLRLCHFLAQCCHESDGLKTFEEYASGQKYEWREDLGNFHEGDGMKFKGRGAIQLTGRHNYIEAGTALKLDLVSHPEQAADPKIGWEVAAWYWISRKLNLFADRNDITTITRRVNGGLNGLQSRREYFNELWPVIRDAFKDGEIK